MMSNADNELEDVRFDHFPRAILAHLEKLYRERRDLHHRGFGSLQHLDPRSLLRKFIVQYGCMHGRDEMSVNTLLLDHWGSIEGGRTLVTEPYMHSSIWEAAEKFAEASGLSMEFIDDSTWNPKEPGATNHRHCSRICFRIKEKNYGC